MTLLIWSSIDSKLGLTKILRKKMILNACHSFYVNSEERRSDVKERKTENIHWMMNGTLKSTKIRHRTYVARFSKTKVFLHRKFFSNSWPFIFLTCFLERSSKGRISFELSHLLFSRLSLYRASSIIFYGLEII